MQNKKEIRWKQRFINFEKAFKVLERTVKIEQPNEAEKGGIVQYYEVCFSLAKNNNLLNLLNLYNTK